jgi:CubicO group peptidase (beta-lactamase class C family)
MSSVPRGALVAAALLAAQSQTTAPTPDLHVAVSVIAARALERPVAGLAVAIARGGTIVEARGFGLADVDRKIPVTPQTVFHAASVSKNILAGVVLHLVEEGKLSLDDDIAKYVAEAPTHGQHVTLRHLLTHTSGLFSYTSVPNAEANEALDLTHEQVLALIKDRPADFPPGASWRYSNTGSYLAGMAVERVTGMTYATYLRSRVFEPLSMTSSSLCTVHDNVPGLAVGYGVQGGKCVPPPRGTWTVPFAGGGVCTTVSDLVRRQNALDEGRFVSRAHGSGLGFSAAGGDVPDDERAALVGRFDSDEGMVESYVCGKALCFRVPGTTEGGAATRISPFVYAVGPDVEVRFPHPPVPVVWGFVYAGGLFADAKRRVCLSPPERPCAVGGLVHRVGGRNASSSTR